MTTSVLVVDNHAVVREGLVAILRDEPDFTVVGEARSGEEALLEVARLRPDVLVVSDRLPVMSGLETCERVVARHPPVGVLVTVTFLEHDTVSRADAAGARGVLLKDSEPAVIRGAVRAVASGARFVDPRARRSPQPGAGAFGLTPRELSVLHLLAGGRSNFVIGRTLGISEDTVKTHVKSILVKLNARGRTEAAAIAIKHGLA